MTGSDVVGHADRPEARPSDEPSTTPVGGEPFDLIVVGGNGIDLATGRQTPLNVGVRSGRIAYLGPRPPTQRAEQVVDAGGGLVIPGLIDLHTHVAWGLTRLGIDPDTIAARSGVTTWVDAGSCGPGALGGLIDHVVARSRVRILPFVNVSYLGLLPLGMAGGAVGELEDLRWADQASVLRAAEQWPGQVRGIKVRISADAAGSRPLAALDAARLAADRLARPLMVHGGAASVELAEVLARLGAGDILTHCFTPARTGGILADDGRPRPCLTEAIDRGVLLDVGHGKAGFSAAVARRAADAGVWPTTISTDLHAFDIDGPVFSLPSVLSVFLALGMPLHEVLRRATAAPADALGEAELGRLRLGSPADIAVIEVADVAAERVDCVGEIVKLTQMIEVRATIAAGRVLDR